MFCARDTKNCSPLKTNAHTRERRVWALMMRYRWWVVSPISEGLTLWGLPGGNRYLVANENSVTELPWRGESHGQERWTPAQFACVQLYAAWDCIVCKRAATFWLHLCIPQMVPLPLTRVPHPPRQKYATSSFICSFLLFCAMFVSFESDDWSCRHAGYPAFTSSAGACIFSQYIWAFCTPSTDGTAFQDRALRVTHSYFFPIHVPPSLRFFLTVLRTFLLVLLLTRSPPLRRISARRETSLWQLGTTHRSAPQNAFVDLLEGAFCVPTEDLCMHDKPSFVPYRSSPLHRNRIWKRRWGLLQVSYLTGPYRESLRIEQHHLSDRTDKLKQLPKDRETPTDSYPWSRCFHVSYYAS